FRRGRDFLLRHFNREDHIPTIDFPLDRAGFYDALDRAGEMDFDFADLRQMKRLAIERKSALRIGEGIISRVGTKARISRFLAFLHATKEIVKGEGDALQYILQNLRIDARRVLALGFHPRQLGALLSEAN